LSTNPVDAWLYNKGWLNLLSNSKTSRIKVCTAEEGENINSILIQGGRGIYDIQPIKITRWGKAFFQKFINTVHVRRNSKGKLCCLWQSFQSTKQN